MRGPSPPPLPTDRAFPPVVQSLASGLLWIAEVIEEHGKLSKTVGRRAVYVRTPSKMGGRRASSKLTSASLCGPGRCCQAVIALHGLFLLVDKFPVWPILFGIACHGVYLVSPPFSPARVEREDESRAHPGPPSLSSLPPPLVYCSAPLARSDSPIIHAAPQPDSNPTAKLLKDVADHLAHRSDVPRVVRARVGGPLCLVLALLQQGGRGPVERRWS